MLSITPPASGERDKLVTIQQRGADAADDVGEPVETWTTLNNAYMKRIDVWGREEFQASQLSAPYDTRWQMAYQANMDPDLLDVTKLRRLKYQGRFYDIVAAALVSRQSWIELSTLASGRAEA